MKNRLVWLVLPLPFIGLAAVSSALTLFAQSGAMEPGEDIPLLLRLVNAAVATVLYLAKTLYPAFLAVLYPYPVAGYPLWLSLVSAALLLLITAASEPSARNQEAP